ncbi:transposase [Gaiella occulta]|uniref:Transposase n=1 Tax=Gaiella occulta TaxID=1002870 RepID=A0A7M2YUR8_9ACTN|nr:transposase [Gaiella occulta]RDI73158.1 transposase [Gaiella occulta]
MARPVVLSVEDKFRLVFSVISGEMSIAEAARRSKVSEQSIGNWKRQFLEGGKQGLADGGRPGSNPQVQRLEAEVEELKAALGEAHVELRVWKKSAEYRLGPTRPSR